MRALILALVLALGLSIPANAASGTDIDAVAESLDEYYTAIFEITGHDYDTPNLVVVEEGKFAKSECGGATASSLHYCPLDNTIFMGQTAIDEISEEFGEFAPYFVLAHEWGHHVQFESGLSRTHVLEDGVWNRTYVIKSELMADCLAGAWTRHAAVEGNLETPDLVTMVTIAASAGSPTATPSNHGTGEQRMAAALVGYTQGMVGCMAIEPLP